MAGAMSFLKTSSHRRRNPLTGEWVLVSPHRTERPWMGQTEKAAQPEAPTYDPKCYLCPGNRRAHGDVNPHYRQTFVFDNDFPALQPSSGDETFDRDGLMVAEAERGACRVICFSPRHDLTLARMAVEDIESVVRGVGRRVPDARRPRRHQCRADFREPRRDDGREQPAPPLPGVGVQLAAQRDGEGARHAVCLLA